MITPTQLQNLRDKLSQAQMEAARLEGQLQTLMDDLREKFGASTIEEADALLAEMEKQEAHEQFKVEELVKLLEDKYGQRVS